VQTWTNDWIWSLPLILINVLFHVGSLVLITEKLKQTLILKAGQRSPRLRLVLVMGSMTVLVTVLHGIDASVWAIAYRFLDALPDYHSAMLYSVSAMTSYGNSDTFLQRDWRMMGALESLNGMLLLGLTTAFLFSMVQTLTRLPAKLQD
jgi:hypothetical protein